MGVSFFLSSVLSVLLGLFFSAFAVINLFATFMGTFGQAFLYEMDVLMGGLLGVPNFSKAEGALLGLSGPACLLAFSRGGLVHLAVVCGHLTHALYLCVCVEYARHARLPSGAFAAAAAASGALAAWRAALYLDWARFGAPLAAFAGAAAAACAVAARRMAKRAPAQQAAVARFAVIKKFLADNPAAHWPRGAPTPHGFAYAPERTPLAAP